ncbi:hydrolase [Streptomyces agglomeratus]|uniref:VOC family protein n=1 Tax=Streptomyces agglomeratus TaxID=285458 RepID=UPI0008545540|nr:VOC family protein [Streptomyces agglomeratus]OEJ43348.1 hydrolase [Streptomyces agglomeratus]OEJ54734.1 hydrolase [Streptomyces agglomeratus]OEJ62106.1 hydrolase [Streptomyces agglomeratus]
MAVQPEGTPCWADAMFTDVEGAKSFYGDVLGWTFGESSSEFGNYTQAYSDGKAVAAVVPPMPGQDSPSAWCLYLASPDVTATAQKIRDNGGEVLMEPMQVGDFGSMLIAKDPSGAAFGVWQAGTHEGFEKRGEPGAYAWAEVFTRDPEKSDAFFPAVFPYSVQRMEDDAMDFKVFNVGDDSVLGRMTMTEEFPPEIPPYIQVYFTVEDCDAAVSKATARGGALHFGPMDSPFGRFAALTDPQGAAFAVIDMKTTKGEMPKMTAA